MQARILTLLLGAVLFPVSSVRAHSDPFGCSQVVVSIEIHAFRSDGVTPVVGPIVGCEEILYQTRISKGQDISFICAFSGGTLTLTTPDGVAHTLSADVPCIGGDGLGEGCDASRDFFDSAPIPYTVAASDVHNGKVTATAIYSGGVVHESTVDTPGLVASGLTSTQVESCEASTTVTTSSSTSTTTTIPKSTCASLKVQAATQLAAAVGDCDARALKFGVAVRPECLEAAADGFTKSWAMAERRGDCLTVNDQDRVQTIVDSCTGALESVLLP